MFQGAEQSLTTLSKGAFLSSGSNPANIMTIAWGGLGFIWRKPVFIAPIRLSRYTKEVLDENMTFAVSIPKEGDYAKELKYCGTVSGRQEDKVAKLATRKATKINTFLVNNCQSYYECKVLAVVPLTPDMLDPSILSSFYKDGDMHYLYIGEIL